MTYGALIFITNLMINRKHIKMKNGIVFHLILCSLTNVLLIQQVIGVGNKCNGHQ